MPLPPRLFPGDEELGKRDDDHKPRSKTRGGVLWKQLRLPARRNMKRVLGIIVVLVVLYYFFMYISNDVENPEASYILPSSDGTVGMWTKSNTETNHKPVSQSPVNQYHDDPGSTSHQTFNGPIKFLELASSLHALSFTNGASSVNRNVMFVASSVKSASILLPLACEMSRWQRNYVHFAFMGRDEIPLVRLKEVNGITDGCEILYHDARPDYSIQSSDLRMEVSCGAAFGHIETYMHPQAVIIDNSGAEDQFCLTALRTQTSRLGRTLIELPSHPEQNLMWFTRLHSSSLKAWNTFSIDILVHAQPAASGSLIRLLTSLSKADYFTLTPPRITIELPHVVDEPTQRFLANGFKWPPGNKLSNANQISLHHRVEKHGLTAEENSIRVVESFWPADPHTSHLLILSPQAELSTNYFHYLQYAILEYRYSLLSVNHYDNLMSISLDLPATFLNDTNVFTPPKLPTDTTSNTNPTSTSFLWQSPNSNAALYFGDKWTEIHSFISYSLISSHTMPSAPKLVSKLYPSWLEHVLALARVRGYYTLYPVLQGSNSLVTIHNELFKPPEEFMTQFDPESHDDETLSNNINDTDWTVDPANHLSLQHKEMPLASTSLMNVLPDEQPPISLRDMPLLSWDGDQLDVSDFVSGAQNLEILFRREVGGCDSSDVPKLRTVGDARDLFCLHAESAKIASA